MSGKYTLSERKSFATRAVFLMLSLILVIGCVIGGTLAWLTAQTDNVENTFIAGQIGALSLDEKADQDATKEGHQFIIIPGVDITKDPKVTYTPTTEDGTVPVDAYVFVKLEGIGQSRWTWNDTAKQYEITSGNNVVLSFKIDEYWMSLNEENVFYRKVSAGEMVGTTEQVEGKTVVTGQSIISSNKIEVSHLITETDVKTVATAADKLTFTAYAIQQQGFETVADAWEEVSDADANETP